MINNLEFILNFKNIYLILNWGVLPFWILLILAPAHTFTRIVAHSVFPIFLLLSAYIFVGYKIYLDGNILNGFNLYLGLENLYTVYSDEEFLLIFWIHFLSISLFIGSWIARDSLRNTIPRFLSIFSLALTYFSGPLGLVFYWFIRIFFTRKFTFNE